MFKKLAPAMLVLAVFVFLVIGCQQQEPATQEESAMEHAEEETPREVKPKFPSTAGLTRAGVDSVEIAEGTKPRIHVESTFGPMTIELWPDVAPLHCKNFIYLTKNGLYDSLNVFRLIPDFMLQAGCHIGDGTGSPGYTIEAEFNDRPHEKGTLSMARSADPNSAGSQFFVCLARAEHLDGAYTAFGEVVEGKEVLDEFNAVGVQANMQRGGEESQPIEPIWIKLSLPE